MPDLFEIDIASGILHRTIPETGEVISATLEDLSDGRLTIQGTIIRDTETGRIVSNLSANRPNFIEQLGEGRLLQQLPKNLSDINSAVSAGGIDAVGFQYTIELPDGRSFSADVPSTAVTPIDGIVIVKRAEDGTLEFKTIVPQVDMLTGDIINMVEGFRIATADEAAQRSVTGYLMNTFRREMDLIAAAGLIDENGDLLGSAYEVAQWIARTSLFNTVGLQLREL